ncbi:MAG: type II secretion system protein [Planctomycetes bacterium]|nr:type II secretion system protein [Planctomycetota bacterium]
MSRLDRRRAFTLIETIAAVVVLAIAIPPLLLTARRATIDSVTPIMFSRARWLAVEKLEDVIGDRHSPQRGYDYLSSGNYPAEDPVTSDPGFSRSVQLSETGADLQTPGTGYMTVTVTVSWTDATATVRSLQIGTVLTEYE